MKINAKSVNNSSTSSNEEDPKQLTYAILSPQ